MKLNTSQKNGILQLSIILFVFLTLVVINQNLNITQSYLKLDQKTTALIKNQECDYLDRIEKKNSKKYYVNSLNDYTAYQIGLNVPQIDLLLKHLKNGHLIFTESEFIKITNISDSQRNEVLPKLKYPKSKNANFKKTEKDKTHKEQYLTVQYSKTDTLFKKQLSKINLNTTTARELEKQLGLPEFIAKRIINYRKHLNGYKHLNQIEKVYDILPYQVKKIKENCIIE